MASKKVEDYAFRYGLSFRQSKRKLHMRGKRRSEENTLPVRRGPVAGTGKKGKATKAGKKG